MVCFGMPAGAALGRFGLRIFAEGSESDERTAVSIRRGYVRAYRVGRETVHDYVGMRAGKTVFCSAIAIFAQG